MKNIKLKRHGDLMIMSVDSIPKNLPIKPDTILLEGEASNHFHRLDGGVVYSITPTIENNFNLGYFELKEEAKLSHEEHDTIVLAPGKYKFFAQREYDEIEDRRVID